MEKKKINTFDKRIVEYKKARKIALDFLKKKYSITERVILAKDKMKLFDKLLVWLIGQRKIRMANLYQDILRKK